MSGDSSARSGAEWRGQPFPRVWLAAAGRRGAPPAATRHCPAGAKNSARRHKPHAPVPTKAIVSPLQCSTPDGRGNPGLRFAAACAEKWRPVGPEKRPPEGAVATLHLADAPDKSGG